MWGVNILGVTNSAGTTPHHRTSCNGLLHCALGARDGYLPAIYGMPGRWLLVTARCAHTWHLNSDPYGVDEAVCCLPAIHINNVHGYMLSSGRGLDRGTTYLELTASANDWHHAVDGTFKTGNETHAEHEPDNTRVDSRPRTIQQQHVKRRNTYNYFCPYAPRVWKITVEGL